MAQIHPFEYLQRCFSIRISSFLFLKRTIDELYQQKWLTSSGNYVILRKIPAFLGEK